MLKLILNRKRLWRVTGLAGLLLLVSTLTAQENSSPATNAPISFGQTVNDTIEDDSFFDLWYFEARAGDEIEVVITASDGLIPLIGLLDGGRNLITRSDLQPDGTLVDAEVNSTVTLRYTLPQDGEYAINVTRAGIAEGTSSGSYALTVNMVADVVNPLQDVVFLCGSQEAVTAASLEFREDVQDRSDLGQPEYRVTVFGLDGFIPVLRFELPQSAVTHCSNSDTGLASAGSSVAIPISPEIQAAITEDNDPSVTQYSVRGETGPVLLTLGGAAGTAGRYVMVLEGLEVEPAATLDRLLVRVGPHARSTEMLVYMVRAENTRIDPVLGTILPEGDIVPPCDDAGRRGCEDLASATGMRLSLPAPEGVPIEIVGGRFDAAARIATESTDPVQLVLYSRTPTTTGRYYLVFIGELPPRP